MVELVWHVMTNMGDVEVHVLANLVYWVWHVRCARAYEGAWWTEASIVHVAMQQVEEFNRCNMVTP